MAEKIIRDPVHDVIAFRLEDATDALLFRLINAVEFQRLRRIRQLGLAHMAYPGADHSRYSHSLGVMETARQMLAQLAKETKLDDADRTACLVAALLHDLGHGPFSHVFERVSNIHHERLTQRVILDPESEIHQTLIKFDTLLPERVVMLLSKSKKRSFLHDLLSSQLDADRLDYLLRDNLMTGSRYGGYDLRWLVHSMTVDAATGRLAIAWKGVNAVEAYLQARYHMYRNVYFHKVVRSAEGMLKLALQRAKRLAVQRRLVWPEPESNVHAALLGQRLSIHSFVDLDDVSVAHCFKLWTKSDDAVLAALCHGLLYRRVFKTIDLSRIDDLDRVNKAVEIAKDVVTKGGGDPEYELFYDEVGDTPYETYNPSKWDAASEILVCDPDGRLREFASISPICEALNREMIFRRIHVAERWKGAVADAIAGR